MAAVQMWKSIWLLTLLVTCSWQMRIKRQDDSGCEWWDKDCQRNEAPPSTAPTAPDSSAVPAIPQPPVVVKNPSPEDVVVTPTGRCACVPFYLCKEDEVITDGEGLLDIREKPRRKKPARGRRQAESKLIGGHCDKSIYVCCKIPDGQAAPAIIERPEAPEIPAKEISVCGQRNPEGVFLRISGFKDNEAQYGEFPWMVAILRPSDTGKVGDVYVCGGSLIHPQVVLTAAHCVAKRDPLTLKVRLGEWDTSKDDELAPHQDVAVVDSIIHEDFYAPAVHNDFALLFLENPAALGGHIDTICLPAPSQAINPSKCIVSGWGKDKFGQEGRFQQVLKKIELPIVPQPVCQDALRTTRLGPYFKLHSSFVCAGGIAGKDTCKGDGGSPLVCPVPGFTDRYVQVGIVAWGIGCGDEIPAVYADVIGATTWIQEKVAQRLNVGADYFAKQLPVSR